MARTLAALAINLQANSALMVQELEKANQSVKKFGEGVAGIGKKAAVFYAVVQSIQAVKDAASGMVQTAATFETLNSSLETVFGSAEVASRRFEDLKKFAAETPFTLTQVTEAAIKMRALGLDPSIESIKSMGNTASAMGKPLMQFVEAVADAATGEMERLKEFGIKAKKEGENFKFIFQGVETTVSNNADAIQKYLIDLGNVQFAGAIEKQAETLPGVFAQATGAVENFAAAFSEKSGLSAAIKSSTKEFTKFINTLTGEVNKMAEQSPVKELETQLAAAQKSLDWLNSEGTKIYGPTQRENLVKERKKEIAAINITLMALQGEARERERIILEQEQKENEARERRAAQIKAEQDAKAAEETQKNENKRLIDLFGGEPEAVLERIEGYLLSEAEIIQNAKIRDLAYLETARAEGLVSDQRFWKLRYGIAANAAKQLSALEKETNDDIVKDKDRFIKQILTSATGGSRALFNIQKAARIAEAVIEGKASAISAWKWGMSIGGPPVAAAFAAGSVAFTAAQIKSIASSGPAGGDTSAGSIPTLSAAETLPTTEGTEALAANDEPEPQTKVVTIAIEGEGELLPRSVLRELADELNSLDEANVRLTV